MIVTRALPADCDLLRLHRQAPARHPLLLQSTSSSSVKVIDCGGKASLGSPS